jgi:deoxycytidine triphosphate deaminase
LIPSQRIKELSLLSDRTKRGLIDSFDSTKLGSYYYNLTIDLIVIPGPSPKRVDLSNHLSNYTIEPGCVVWIRMKELITLPANILASLEQTHHHTRRGISFLNLSQVFPNYSGYLTCAIANFTSAPIEISCKDHIARLVFFELEKSTLVSQPLRDSSNQIEYDQDLISEAKALDNSFFGLTQVSQNITKKVNEDLEKSFKKVNWSLTVTGAILVTVFTILPILEQIFTKKWLGDSIVMRSELPGLMVDAELRQLIEEILEQKSTQREGED